MIRKLDSKIIIVNGCHSYFALIISRLFVIKNNIMQNVNGMVQSTVVLEQIDIFRVGVVG